MIVRLISKDRVKTVELSSIPDRLEYDGAIWRPLGWVDSAVFGYEFERPIPKPEPSEPDAGSSEPTKGSPGSPAK